MVNARIFISKTKNIRRRIVLTICIATIFLVGIVISSFFIESSKLGVNLTLKNKPPSWGDLFGTDWLGRDMFARTLKGLSLSFGVGLLAAFVSTLIALIFSLLASIDRRVDAVVSWFIDLFLSVPHIVTLILISFAMGGGFKGVVLGLALTHWPSLTRVLRAEVMQIKATDYVAVSLKLGQSRLWIAIHHILPHILPQLFVAALFYYSLTQFYTKLQLRFWVLDYLLKHQLLVLSYQRYYLIRIYGVPFDRYVVVSLFSRDLFINNGWTF